MQTWRSYTKHTTIINHTKSCEQQDWGWKNGNIATIMITLEPGDVPCYMLLEQLQAISHRKGHDFGASEHGQLHNFMAMKAMTWCLGHELCLFCSRTLSHYRWLVPYFWRLFHIFENKTQVKFLHIYIYIYMYVYIYICIYIYILCSMFGPELWIAFTWYHVLHLCRFPGSLARRAQSSKSCVRRGYSGHGGHGGYGFSTASRCSALNQGNCGSLQMTLTLSFEYLPYLPQNQLGLVFIPLFFLFCCCYSLGATSLDRFGRSLFGDRNKPNPEESGATVNILDKQLPEVRASDLCQIIPWHVPGKNG